MAKDLDLITVLDQLGAHFDLMTSQLAGIIDPANVKGSHDHVAALANHTNGPEKGI